MQRIDKLLVSLSTMVACAFPAAFAADLLPLSPTAPAPQVGGGATLELMVPLFKSRVVTVAGPAARVSVGSPDIADIVVISPSQLYVLGKDIGTTNVLLWDSGNRLIGTISVEVQHDLEDLKRKYAEILPGEPIEVRSAQRSIVLSGRVSDTEKLSAAVRIAQTYLAQIQPAGAVAPEVFKQESNSRRDDKTVGEVINLLQVGGVQQVMLEVKVAEMQRSEVRNLDAKFNAFRNGGNITWGGVNGGATFPPFKDINGLEHPVYTSVNPSGDLTQWGPPVADFVPNPLSIVNQGLFGSFINTNFLFNLALDAAKNQGLAKILAEPNLTTLTGQEAKFLSGGQFPIPVATGLNQVTIEYKDFGVSLDFIPVVLSNGHINLKLSIGVSELVNTSTLGISVTAANSTFIVPSLTVRNASGTVELGDGQTIGLAGLLNDNLTQSIEKFPGLGELPILGALFRSQSFIKGDTELVILVTPHLAKPLARSQIKLPTDSFIEPSDADFYLWGRMEGQAPANEQK
jgi:pilus assembly protein CpaC